MLTPEYLDHIADPVVQLFQDVEDDILRDMARRIKKMDGLTDTAAYQAWRLEQTQLVRKNIVTRLSNLTGKTQAEIRRIFQEAATETLRFDDIIYTAAGLSPGTINDNPALLNLLNAGYQQTAGTFKNITATTANTATQQFENALDHAWLQVSSGAFDYQTVLRRTVDALAKDGIKTIFYPTGHKDKIEVAVRRALLTGINQTAAKLQIARMDEMGCDLVEVTAHSGARPSHAVWQGKVYSRSGKSSKYPPLSVTGYGTGAGLCGWNCRHNFYPFFEGLSVPNYTEEALERLNRKEFTYKGKEMTRYEATQYQRYLERNIRAWKRKYLAEEAAGVDTTRTSVKLAQWRARQKDFLDKTGLFEDNIRHRVSGFGHRQASKAVAQAKKANKLAAENQYRKAHNTGAYAVLEERMSLKHVRSLVKDMDISLDGTKIKIIRDKTLIGDSRWMGYTYPDGSAIQLYPAAFSSREELVKTLGHEFMHLKQVRESGTIQSVEELTRREREAYDSEQHWWNEYRRKTGFDK